MQKVFAASPSGGTQKTKVTALASITAHPFLPQPVAEKATLLKHNRCQKVKNCCLPGARVHLNKAQASMGSQKPRQSLEKC